MVLGECGRLPLYVEYHCKAVKYWTKLIHMPIHRYPGNCYKMIKSLDDIGRETWASSVKQLLYLYGFGILWVTQEIGDTDLFLSVFSQRLKDCATQNWRDMINNSNRCSFYKNFKSLLTPEKYLTMGLSYQLRKALARFRCSSHTLNIELGRHLGIDRDDRICTFCLDIYQINCIEDEFHVFFQCPRFSELQIKYLYNWFNGNPTRHDLYHLLSSTNDFVIRKVAIFIHKVLQLETSEI